VDRSLLFCACLLASTLVAGCGSSGGAPPPASTTSTSLTNSTAAPGNATEPPPAPTEVFNETFQFNANSVDAPKAFDLGKPGRRIDFFASVRTVNANTPTYLQPEQGQNQAYILVKHTSTSASGRANLEAVLQATPARGDLELKRYTASVSAPADGAWSVEAHGVGQNVKVWVVAKEIFG